MDIITVPILLLFKAIINLAIIIILSDVIASWLVAANILNIHNQLVYMITSSLSKASEFILYPVRKVIPTNFGMFDVSPIVLLLLLTFLENVINRILMKFFVV